MQVPKIEKIVINMGVGDAVQNAKAIDTAVEELTFIAGQNLSLLVRRSLLLDSVYVKECQSVRK